jgi:hypothetical protein
MTYTDRCALSFIYTVPYNITMMLRRDHDVNVITLHTFVGLQQSEVTVVMHSLCMKQRQVTYVMHVFSGGQETGE